MKVKETDAEKTKKMIVKETDESKSTNESKSMK